MGTTYLNNGLRAHRNSSLNANTLTRIFFCCFEKSKKIVPIESNARISIRQPFRFLPRNDSRPRLESPRATFDFRVANVF